MLLLLDSLKLFKITDDGKEKQRKQSAGDS